MSALDQSNRLYCRNLGRGQAVPTFLEDQQAMQRILAQFLVALKLQVVSHVMQWAVLVRGDRALPLAELARG